MTSEYLTCKADILIDEQLVYPIGTLLRVTGRDGDTVHVSGRVNDERRKRWLSKSLCCELPTTPEGEFWQFIFPTAPADRARLFSARGASGGFIIDGDRAKKLMQWVAAHPTHTNTPEGMQIAEHGYTLTLKYLNNDLRGSIWWYFFDFTLKAMETVNE